MQVTTTVLEIVGVAAIVAAAALVDWRVGMAVAGGALILLSWALSRRPRRRR